MNIHNVLLTIENGDIFSLKRSDFADRRMSQREALAIFNNFDAYWKYEGEISKEKPHAILKNEDHSNGFIPCKIFLDYPSMCSLFAGELVKIILEKELFFDVIASSAYSAINLGYETARILSATRPKIKYVAVEKDSFGNPTIIRGGIPKESTVLIINELMTSADGSTWETKNAVLTCNGENPPPKIIDESFVLIHRSKDYQLIDGSKVVPVFHFDIEDWHPDECPYCKAGSQAIKPKNGDNWKIIHGRN